MSTLQSVITQNVSLKNFVHRLIVNRSQSRPRQFVKSLINPWFHERSSKAILRRSVRKDLFPFNQFAIGTKSVIEDFSTLNNGVGDIRIGETL